MLIDPHLIEAPSAVTLGVFGPLSSEAVSKVGGESAARRSRHGDQRPGPEDILLFSA
jgi:hypothetical protein